MVYRIRKEEMETKCNFVSFQFEFFDFHLVYERSSSQEIELYRYSATVQYMYACTNSNWYRGDCKCGFSETVTTKK